MKTCFVVCPIGEDGTPTRKRSDQSNSPQDKAVEIFFQEFMRNPQKAVKAMNQLSKIDFPNQL